MKLKYEPKDFLIKNRDQGMVSAVYATKIAQKKYDEFIEQQPVVYGHKELIWMYGPPGQKSVLDTHTARLVNIEEIEK